MSRKDMERSYGRGGCESGKPLASLISLGCAKNLVDSEMMAPQLTSFGFELTEDPARASVLVVNTCGFLQSAVEEAIETVLELALYKDSGECRCLVVAGCMVQRYGKKLLSLLPEVDVFLGTSHYHRLNEALASWESEKERRLWIGPPRHLFESSAPRARSSGFPSAYLKIAEGCGNGCSFCMIPRLRGPYRSRSLRDILDEGRRLAAEGVKEINLVAQDTTAFGLDREAPGGLVGLLDALETISGVEWIRLLYTYPDRVDERLLRNMAQSRKVLPYLDVPFQHCVPRILKAMGREKSSGGVEKTIDLIRHHLPDVALRTSLIVGFPGETESDFEELAQFVERMEFDHLGAFAFSPEAGSRAARLMGQVPEETRKERRHVLMELQKAISRKKLEQYVGSVLPVLVEGFHPETEMLLSGRLPRQAPEVDGTVIITEGLAEIGEILPAHILAAHDYDVEARLIRPDGA